MGRLVITTSPACLEQALLLWEQKAKKTKVVKSNQTVAWRVHIYAETAQIDCW